MPEVEKSKLPAFVKDGTVRTIPIEDIGVVILDNKEITITQNALSQLLDNNAAVITCDDKRMPVGLLMPLESNTIQSERFSCQISASIPLKKNLWQQTVQSKILNQAASLKTVLGSEQNNMIAWSKLVKSGDSGNLESRAAAYYWNNYFPEIKGFTRSRDGMAPNVLLNYGYALLRAVIARSLTSSGLLPTLGIHHKNKYNAYCLADDIMEPYRPYVDILVRRVIEKYGICENLSHEIKAELLGIVTEDVVINSENSPLQVAASITSASLFKCFSGESKKIIYPVL